jgi:hypothetical protein
MTKNHSFNTKFDYSSEIPKLSFFDPYYPYEKRVKVKHGSLVFHMDTTIMNSINEKSQVNTNFICSKALPANIEYEKPPPYFSYHPHEI